MKVRAYIALAAALGLLAGCGSDSATAVDDAGRVPGRSADGPAAATTAGDAVYVEQLHADTLHRGVAPAEPGTAYIEIANRRFDFASVDCTGSQGPRGETYSAAASDDSEGAGHLLYLARSIGPNVSWAWEDEHVQLARLITPAGAAATREQFSNSTAQHSREQGAAPVWSVGGGQSPLVRIVGHQATAVGTLAAQAFGDSPLEGDFVAALTCPDAS